MLNITSAYLLIDSLKPNDQSKAQFTNYQNMNRLETKDEVASIEAVTITDETFESALNQSARDIL